VDEGHHDQQELGMRHRVQAKDAEREDQVEVETTERGAELSAAPEAVRIGDVRVEHRIDEIEAGAHRAHGPTAVAESGAVTDLVEGRGENERHEQDEDQAGRIEDVVDALSHAVYQVEPRVRGGRGRKQNDEHGREVEDLEETGDRV